MVIFVDGRKVDRPSYLVDAGNVITIRDLPRIQTLYRTSSEGEAAASLAWLHFDPEHLQATVCRLPGADDISLPVEINRVVELLSR